MGPAAGTEPPHLGGAQPRLESAWRASRAGSTTGHVVVVLPSLNLPPVALHHFAERLPGLEHRYLVEVLALARSPGAELAFVTCQAPAQDVLDYYLGLCPPVQREDVLRRLHVVVVPDLSPRSLSVKLLEHPSLLAQLREIVGDRPALVEPWNVTDAEIEVGERIGAPVRGTPPRLWPEGYKGAGRRLFRALGIPVVPGAEDLHEVDDLVRAAAAVGQDRPSAGAVVVKHDDSCSGKGNRVLPLRDNDGQRLDASGLREQAGRLPREFLEELHHGAVVEELLEHPDLTSPSVQADIDPAGQVQVLSTHEQILGEDGLLYLGCQLPARADYSTAIARDGLRVAEELAARGVRGRLSVDFIGVPRGGGWDLRAVEVNLRRGGATHPFTVLQALVPGRYDVEAGRYRTDAGGERCYVAGDNLVDPAWTGLDPGAVVKAVERAGAAFDPSTRVGVVLHAFPMLAIDGRIGLTAIAPTLEQAGELQAATRQAMDSLVGAR